MRRNKIYRSALIDLCIDAKNLLFLDQLVDKLSNRATTERFSLYSLAERTSAHTHTDREGDHRVRDAHKNMVSLGR